MKALILVNRAVLIGFLIIFSAISTASDRYGTISGIVATWEPNLGKNEGWAREFTEALNRTTDEQLLDIQNAESYDQIRAILQGKKAPATLDGVSGTEDLGDLDQDLVYSPVFPCRIFDTRNVGPAPGNNAVRNYFVHGTPGGLNAQGGNPAGCPPPPGKNEPVGISVNLAAVPVSPVGHLRVYPYLGTRPEASFLNYFGGGNIANSGLITTCYLCGPDITVFNRNTAHSFADVMGYFFPAKQDPVALDCTTAQSAIVAVPRNVWTFVDAFCPSGYTATGGGFRVPEGTLGRPNVWVDQLPYVTGGVPTGWRSLVDNQAAGASRNVQTYAICCRNPGF